MDSPITDVPAISSEVAETVTRLRSDLENVQRELEQALGVWRSALIAEKKEFQSLLQAKQLTWNEQETEWQAQRAGYEQRIQDLETSFKTQLAVREQHAVQALNELDDSWQRDKLLWDQATVRRVKELEEREISWKSENEKQAARILELQEKNVQLESATLAAAGDTAALDELKKTFQQEKESWQESLAQRLQEFHQRDVTWVEALQKKDRVLQSLESELADLRERLKEFEEQDAAAMETSRECAETTVRSLEHQVATLDSMIRLYASDNHSPQRRKTDRALR